jgi:hypothetical protein
LGSKRSLSCVTVPGVQADIEVTAARIESAVAGREAITIKKNTGYGTYSVIELYALYNMPVREAMMFHSTN